MLSGNQNENSGSMLDSAKSALGMNDNSVNPDNRKNL